MSGTWNKCFLCLSDMPSVSRKRKRRISSVNLEIILKYLLQTNKDDNHLFQSILQLQSCETDGDEPLVKLCERCESAKQKISELHQQLEVVQMKLIDSIRSVRKAIIQASDQVVRLEGNGVKFNQVHDVFEGSSDRTNAEANSSKFQNVLKAFQNSVQERDKECTNVPFVYLERCLRYTKVPQAQSWGQKSIRSVMTKDFLVKTESEPCLDDSIDDDDGELVLPEADVKMEPCCEDEPPDITDDDKTDLARHPHQSTVKHRRRKRKRRRFVYTITKKRKKMVVDTSKIKKEAGRKNYLPFACKICPYQLLRSDPYRVEHHLSLHETTEKNYKCPHCPAHEGFTGEQLFQVHLNYHKKATGMTCPYCNKRLLKFEMCDHYRTHVDQAFQCEGCVFSSTSHEKFLEHSACFRSRTEKLTCHICKEEFRLRKRLLTHLHQVHQAIEMKACDFEGCGRKFFNEIKLMTHKNRNHSGSFVCQECGKAFVSAYGLEAHQRVHTGELPYPCDECSQAFRLKQMLANHKVREHSAPKYKCGDCGKEYTQSSKLLAHVEAIHEGMRYPCEYCDKEFNTSSQLKVHLHRHTSQDRLVCEVCKKKFTFLQNLRKHMLIHTGEKNFVCNYCSKSFTFDSYLQNHLRTHTGDKPFLCAYCGKAFNQVAGLYLHKKSQHLEEFELERLAKNC